MLIGSALGLLGGSALAALTLLATGARGGAALIITALCLILGLGLGADAGHERSRQ